MKKKLHQFKEKIYTCSKCGLCQSVCPIFDVTKNDTITARGKCILLNGLLNDEIEQSKELTKSLDFCLKCNRCKIFCPSNIDIKEILDTILEPKINPCNTDFNWDSPAPSPLDVPCRIIFHKPCHFDKMDEFFEFIKQNKHIDLVSIETDCCGWGESFGQTHTEISQKISKKLTKKLSQQTHNQNIDYIVTTCENCQKGLLQGYTLTKPAVILLK